MEPFFTIGLDIGTTSIKIIVLGNDGNIAWNHSLEHELLTPSPGFAEEDPFIWENNLYHLFQLMMKEVPTSIIQRIKAIGVTGMVPTLIPLDSTYRPLTHSIQQQDIRASLEIELLSKKIDPAWFFALTGNRLNQQHIGPKLLWLQAHQSEVFSQMKHIMGSYDYIRYLLCGVASIERNWALESGMWDISKQSWIPEIISLSGISESILPPVVGPLDIVGTTTERFTALTGFPSGVDVVGGSADHIASAFSTGARNHGDLVLKLGGAGDILLSVDNLITDDRLFIDYQCDGSNHYVLNGCTATSGSLLKWFKREAHLPDFETMDDEAASVGPLSAGITVLPYFMGEKTPLFDVNAKGVIFGLSLSHTKIHIYRAILEAVAYSFRHHLEVFAEHNILIQRVYITNGGSKSSLWRSILADVIGHDVYYIGNHPGSCLGGAVIAGKAVGIMDDGIIDQFLETALHIPYSTENHSTYINGYSTYRKLYESLKSLMITSGGNA